LLESKVPWSAVTVCVTLSVLVQVTVVPTEMLSVAGVKEKFAMLTLAVVALPQCPRVCVAKSSS
jgi:hypothetical protein